MANINEQEAPQTPLWRMVNAATLFWAIRCSILSIPGFTTAPERPDYGVEPREYAAARDWVYVLFLLAAALAYLASESMNSWPRLLGFGVMVVASYRIVDLFVLAIRLAIFHGHDKTPGVVPKRMLWKRQRSIIVMALSYIEAIAWFAVLYIGGWVANGGGWEGGGLAASQPHLAAMLLSVSTQTTVGYGSPSPNMQWSVMLASVQAVYGVLLVAMTLGTLISAGTSE